jgi:hypothetical protein
MTKKKEPVLPMFGTTYEERAQIAENLARSLDLKLAEIVDLVIDGISIDGAHHKQYYLEKIADVVGINHESKGIAS